MPDGCNSPHAFVRSRFCPTCSPVLAQEESFPPCSLQLLLVFPGSCAILVVGTPRKASTSTSTTTPTTRARLHDKVSTMCPIHSLISNPIAHSHVVLGADICGMLDHPRGYRMIAPGRHPWSGLQSLPQNAEVFSQGLRGTFGRPVCPAIPYSRVRKGCLGLPSSFYLLLHTSRDRLPTQVSEGP